MILDFNIELSNIESQPEWIAVSGKIKRLVSRRKFLYDKYQKTAHDRILQDIEEIDQDIILFERILIFWERNYTAMANLKSMYEAKIEDLNKTADLRILIDDLKMLLDYENQEISILNEVILTAYRSKMDAVKMETALNSLRQHVISYKKYLNGKLEI